MPDVSNRENVGENEVSRERSVRDLSSLPTQFSCKPNGALKFMSIEKTQARAISFFMCCVKVDHIAREKRRNKNSIKEGERQKKYENYKMIK